MSALGLLFKKRDGKRLSNEASGLAIIAAAVFIFYLTPDFFQSSICGQDATPSNPPLGFINFGLGASVALMGIRLMLVARRGDVSRARVWIYLLITGAILFFSLL